MSEEETVAPFTDGELSKDNDDMAENSLPPKLRHPELSKDNDDKAETSLPPKLRHPFVS